MNFSTQEKELAVGAKQNEMAAIQARVDSWKDELRSEYQRAKTELPRIKKLCAEGLQFFGEAAPMVGNLNLFSLGDSTEGPGDLGQLRDFCDQLPRQIEKAIEFYNDISYKRIGSELEFSECLVITRRQLRSWDGATGYVNKTCGKIKTAIKEALAARPGALPSTSISIPRDKPTPPKVESDFPL